MNAIWYHTPSAYGSEERLQGSLKKIADMGIKALLAYVFQGSYACYKSQILPVEKSFEKLDLLDALLKEAGMLDLEVHATTVTLNVSNPDMKRNHKDWFVVSRLRQNCVDNPPYIPGYTWFCPSREEPIRFVLDYMAELAANYAITGVSLDYIRLPDIILPSALRKNYNLPYEEQYFPQFDYCYCDVCRGKFHDSYGKDPLEINPEGNSEMWHEWVQWRCDRITEVVQGIKRTITSQNGSIKLSAAIFPTPELSKRYVFQDWAHWPLDFLCPMIYHSYYDQPLEWIETATREGVQALKGKPLMSGLHMAMMQAPGETSKAIQHAFKGGAQGITVFAYPPSPWQCQEIKESLKAY